MDASLLYEYTELAKRLNFTDTARSLNMSQPTLSKHISALEKSMRVTLFDRSTSNLRLTRSGVELLPYAYRMLAAQSQLEAKVRELRADPPANLVVSGLVNEELVTEALGHVISTLGPSYGTNFLDVKSFHHKTSEEILGSSNVDLIFDYAEEDELDDSELVECVPIGTIPWIALFDRSNPLSRRASVGLDDLANETLVKIEGSHFSNMWRFIERGCRKRGFQPRTRRQYSMKLTDLLTTSANLGNDTLILSANFIKRVGMGIVPFCTQVPIDDPEAYFPISAMYRIDNDNPILDEAVDAIKDYASQGNASLTHI